MFPNFTAGQSGNPAGRPKRNPEIVEAFKAHSLEAAERLLEIARGKLPGVKVSEQIKAIEIILAYAIGKPRQVVELERYNRPIIFPAGVSLDEPDPPHSLGSQSE